MESRVWWVIEIDGEFWYLFKNKKFGGGGRGVVYKERQNRYDNVLFWWQKTNQKEIVQMEKWLLP